MKRLLILALCLAGCTSVGTFTDPEGKVWTAKVNGNAESKIKVGKDGKMEMSIKRSPIIEMPEIDDIKIGGDD